jgi:hypothetical protein
MLGEIAAPLAGLPQLVDPVGPSGIAQRVLHVLVVILCVHLWCLMCKQGSQIDQCTLLWSMNVRGAGRLSSRSPAWFFIEEISSSV